MLKLSLSIALLAAAVAFALVFIGLPAFNLLVPKDGGVALLARDVAYGPHPRQRLDVYAPDGKGPFPVLLFVHGGSWDSGGKAPYAFAAHAFAARGFVVAVADYRLVPEVHYPDFVDDVALAVTWLDQHGAQWKGDGRGVFAVGHSSGAYNVVQAVLRNGLHGRVRAFAALAGPFDFLPLDSPKSIAAFGREKNLAATQPINLDVSEAPPLLLLHGLDDTTVGPYNSQNLFAHFKTAGRATELKTYAGIGHRGILLALSQPLRWRAPALEDVVGFFQRYD
jgi:acetyl esterase/lipase